MIIGSEGAVGKWFMIPCQPLNLENCETNSHLYGLGIYFLHFYLGSDSFGDSVHCIRNCSRRSFLYKGYWEMVIYCLTKPALGEGYWKQSFL